MPPYSVIRCQICASSQAVRAELLSYYRLLASLFGIQRCRIVSASILISGIAFRHVLIPRLQWKAYTRLYAQRIIDLSSYCQKVAIRPAFRISTPFRWGRLWREIPFISGHIFTYYLSPSSLSIASYGIHTLMVAPRSKIQSLAPISIISAMMIRPYPISDYLYADAQHMQMGYACQSYYIRLYSPADGYRKST